MPEEAILPPECYKRHVNIETHIAEGIGWRNIMVALVLAVIVQIGAFLVMWGSLTEKVNKNTEYLWGTISANTSENTRNIDRILAKLDSIKTITLIGERGAQGIQGVAGKDAKGS